jgi:hypothetical protein
MTGLLISFTVWGYKYIGVYIVNVSASVKSIASFENDIGEVLLPEVYIEVRGIPEDLPAGTTKKEMEQWLRMNASALLTCILAGSETFNEITEYLWKLNMSYRVKVRQVKQELASNMVKCEGVLEGVTGENESQEEDT